ncbi:MAG: NPCBM/NEW2 domain-containing protein, partial [Verrucomicrobia bacterium]|nr:NPCBM/NEW2 domain-containing protein [Verrucomicrobiota bacterium]
VPVVGPYRIATGGQSVDMDAMPDRYQNGKRYVEAYLREMGDAGRVIGVEDYASGWAGTEPNLKRLWREVIAPHDSPGVPRELWMLEYGPICGIGPWNFYPSRWHGVYTGYESAFRLARMVHQQLHGGVSSFFFWKAYDGVGDGDLISSLGLIKSARHDRELRPPYHTARVLWKHVPRGAQHLTCTADAGILANAVVKDGRFTILMTNPRSCPVSAEVAIAGVNPAPQAHLHSSTEEVVYQERDVACHGPRSVSVLLPPRSVNALVVREARVGAPFERTVWPDAAASCVYLSDLQWAGVGVVGKSGLMQNPIDGKDVAVRQDETPAHDWLTVGGVRYRKGLGTRVPSEVVFALDGGYAAFEALVGIDDASRRPAKDAGVIFEVLVDGQKAFTSELVHPGQPPRQVRIPCTGAKTLRLTVTGAAGTMADWCEARLLR